jgi:sporulation protein YlmC with PRC-barrel domain
MKNLKEEQGKLILPGATKEAVKGCPSFNTPKQTTGKKDGLVSKSRDLGLNAQRINLYVSS